VTQPTVSRALRDDPRVAPKTAARIKEAALRLGYVPHSAARSLVTKRSGNVAVLVAELNNPFYPELLEVLHSELDSLGLHAVLLSERIQTMGESVVSLLRSELVDGAIVATATLDAKTEVLLREQLGSIVLLIRDVPGSGRDAVVADNAGGAALAARHLLELGHRRIASITGPPDTWTARERAEGFERELERSGLRSSTTHGDYSHDAGYKGCLDLLAADSPPTAIFCGNDVIALGALDAARATGVEVPSQLSIVGFDDIALAGWESFRLTTVRQPLPEMARRAARILAATIEGKEPAGERLVLPTELVVRASTAAPS
jgi:LacI family transcriptional regulator